MVSLLVLRRRYVASLASELKGNEMDMLRSLPGYMKEHPWHGPAIVVPMVLQVVAGLWLVGLLVHKEFM